MENKVSFYRTYEEKKLKRVVDNFYNDLIGGNENAYLDGNEYTPYTEESLINDIADAILIEENYLCLEDSWDVLEAKHIRFMGKKRVIEIVEHRVKFRHNKEGKWMWEK